MLSQENTLKLIYLAQSGDENAKQTLIAENFPLIKSVIRRFKNKSVEDDDLYQLGCMGFLKAINNFQPEFNVRFSTYAVPMIAGEIKRFMRDDGCIKVSRAIKSLNIQISKFIETFVKENGYKPSIEIIAKQFNIDSHDVVFTMDSARMPISLWAPLEEDENKSLAVVDRCLVANDCDNILDDILLKDALKGLEKRDKQIIMLRYFKDKTQSEIAEILHISQVQVSRLENKILQKLKQEIM